MILPKWENDFYVYGHEFFFDMDKGDIVGYTQFWWTMRSQESKSCMESMNVEIKFIEKNKSISFVLY